jgi:hypothetical protein
MSARDRILGKLRHGARRPYQAAARRRRLVRRPSPGRNAGAEKAPVSGNASNWPMPRFIRYRPAAGCRH